MKGSVQPFYSVPRDFAKRPVLVAYKLATPSWGFRWNRYPSKIIGAALHLHRWSFGIVWSRP